MTDLLRVEHVERRFGGLRALNGVDLSVATRERLAVIGPNGAGKTTLFNVIAGELSPTSGRVLLGGEDVTRRRPDQRAVRGLGRTFQKNNLFLGLSVFENVRLAVQRRHGVSWNAFSPAASHRTVMAETTEQLDTVRLRDRAGATVRELSYGEQRQLEVAVALACRPRLLLLDEPTAGMSPAETIEMIDLVKGLPPDLTLLIIEHDMDVVFALADRIVVLHHGEVLAEGRPEEVRKNPRVMAVYLGTDVTASGLVGADGVKLAGSHSLADPVAGPPLEGERGARGP